MEFVCPLCGKIMERELLNIRDHTDEHVVEAIKDKHPKWAEEDGSCSRCYEYYKKQFDFDK